MSITVDTAQLEVEDHEILFEAVKDIVAAKAANGDTSPAALIEAVEAVVNDFGVDFETVMTSYGQGLSRRVFESK